MANHCGSQRQVAMSDKVASCPDPTTQHVETSHSRGESQGWLEKMFKPKAYKPQTYFTGRLLLWTTSAFVSLGDGLFGYDQGIMAGLLVNPVYIKRFFIDHGGSSGIHGDVDPIIVGITVACLQLAAAVGSIAAAYIGDAMGRRMAVRVGGIIYFITAFVQAFAPNLSAFIIGRSIQGLGVGFLSMTVPIIQTEIASSYRRGLMVGIEYTFLIGGYALSCWVDFGFYFALPSNISWQGPYFVQCSLAFVLVVGTFLIPETPRWLYRHGFERECVQTIADLHTDGNIDDPRVQATAVEIEQAVRHEATIGDCSWAEMFTRYRKRTIVGITAQMFAQLNGINVISFYLPSSLAAAGFSDARSLLFTAANALPYTAATVVTWYLADKWGRRPLLILGGSLMAITMGIMCVFTEANINTDIRANGVYSFVVLYNAVYGFTWGPIPWLLPAEVFPLRARAKGMALATCSNWIFNFAIGMSSPSAFAGISGYYYIIIAGFCLFSVGLVYLYYVETANKTLEEIAIVFGDKAFEGDDERVVQTSRELSQPDA